MSSRLSTLLTKKSNIRNAVLDPYFIFFIIVLVLTILVVLYCFTTVYDKNFFKNLL